jgi:hypothetical protein
MPFDHRLALAPLAVAALVWGAGAVRAQDAAAAPAQESAPAAVATAELAPNVTFEVKQLKRMADKGVTELRFAVANAGETDTTLKDLGLASPYRLQNIHLIDFAAKKQYDIGQAASCLCSSFKDGDGGVVRAGERREFWAWYAPLPASARQVAIQLESVPPLMNVPVQQQ